MRTPPGYVVARDASPIDGAPYVAVLILRPRNIKTGDMAQVFILRRFIR